MAHNQHESEGSKTPEKDKGVALGAGIGIIFGGALGNPGVGMVFGAALGLVFGPALVRKFG